MPNVKERTLTDEQLKQNLEAVSQPNTNVLIKIKKENEFIDLKRYEKIAFWEKNKLVGLEKIPTKEQIRIQDMLPYPEYFYYCDKNDLPKIKAMLEAEKAN